MAWIESHVEISKHPKTLNLAAMMGWSVREAVGSLHIFWHWCVDYAEDGDLRRYNDAVIASVVALNPEEGARFVEALVRCGGEVVSGFVDREPYFRVHDWWDYIGPYLRSKYKHNPAKWRKIQRAYINGSKKRQRTGITVGRGISEVLKSSSSEGRGGEPLPDWLPRDSWEEFCASRKRKSRTAITAKISQRIIGVLDELRALGHDPAAVLAQAVNRNWISIEIEWVHKGGTTPGSFLSQSEIEEQDRIVERMKAQHGN